MSQEINRLLMQYEQLMRQTNRARINPEIEELSIEHMRPIADLVARSRASYLKYLYTLSHKYKDSEEFPSEAEMQQLKKLRIRFLDLADGAKSIEISIQRGYLDLE